MDVQHFSTTHYIDNLGTENNLKYYSNECHVMAEILLSSSEIEELYGEQVQSRMKKQFNLIAFNESAKIKRV